MAIMLRTVRRLRGAYDLPVTANNEADFGAVGVQYVHYPWNTLPRPDVDIRWYHISTLLPLYYPAEEAALRAHLATRAPLFSAERFMREIRAAVAEAAATP